MTYSNFLRTMLTYQKISKDLSELYDIGIDFLEGKYRLSELIYDLFESSFESHYTKEGIEWISWFVFEAEYGTHDFSKVSAYVQKEDGTYEIIHEKDKIKWGATDKDGNPIAYSFESLWELLEKEYKID